MIIFQNIRWKNFLSTGNQYTDINLDKHSTTLIVGTNGSGKSTILDALTFSLFNKPFRKISKSQLINTVNEKDCRVEVEFSIAETEWKVVRGIKPNLFEIHRNGKRFKLVLEDILRVERFENTKMKGMRLIFRNANLEPLEIYSSFDQYNALLSYLQNSVVSDRILSPTECVNIV